MFKEVNPKVDYPKVEEGVIDLWRELDAFGKVQELRRGGPVYTFYEGPPTANGMPHIGHVLPRSLKDLFPRYKTMLGYYVPRKAGWDTHGLPVELEVEKRLGITSKPDIEKYGVDRFIAECKKSVWKYEKEWERLTERIGFWLDMSDAYVTYHTTYIESVWWALKQIWDKGWLYQGYRVVPYCARCGTSLSSHEVAQGYADVEDPSVFVRLPLVDRLRGETGTNGCPVSLLVWTTTPWTLPSHTAVAVNPDLDYVALVPAGAGEVLVVAAVLAPKVFDEGYEALFTIKGRDLVGCRYEPPFSFFRRDVEQGLGGGGAAPSAAGTAGAVDWSKVWTVVPASFVTVEDGTGLVHLSPAFGEDDMAAARDFGLPVFRPVDSGGRFTAEVEPWRGRFVKDVDSSITDALRESGRLYRSTLHKHAYPFCYRCDTPLLYYADTGWFIKMTAVRDELIRLNRDQVTWYPEHIKEGRFGDWLENLVDWNLSRNRYWGTPLPVWECRGPGDNSCHRVCIGSIEELKKLAKPETIPEPFDPHRPYIDNVILNCPECGREMRRVPELIDVWFDSGSMPFAQFHFPFENREEFELNFPADFICEAVDQTRGWFYSLQAIAAAVFGRPAYKHCVVTEFGVDEQGRKMSKHIGNVLDPWEILNVQGADALRWFLYAVSHPWFQKRFSSKVISEFQSRMQDTLWNVYSFFVLYANLDGFEPDAAAVAGEARQRSGLKARLGGREVDVPPVSERSHLDRWILSRLHRTVSEVRGNLDEYQVLPATRAIEAFVDDLSNWYVRRGRRRYWRAGTDQDKVAAYQTLYEVLVTLVRLLAPFTPFTTEAVYQNLARSGLGAAGGASGPIPESVHHCSYPECETELIDASLEGRMETVRAYVGLARAARNRVGIKTRQPLRRVVLIGQGASLDGPEGLGALAELLADEVNVKEVSSGADLAAYAVYSIKPRFNILGPRLGPLAPKVAKALSRLGPEEAAALARRLSQGESLEVSVEGQETPIILGPGDLEVRIESRQGWSVEGEEGGGRFVALDAEISRGLLMEGLAREMVNRLQRLRKEAGFEVEDHIETVYQASGEAGEALATGRAHLAAETLSDRFEEGDVPGRVEAEAAQGGLVKAGGWFVQAFDLEGDPVTVAVRRLGPKE